MPIGVLSSYGVVGEECLSPAEACLPLPFPIVLLSLHLLYI